MQLREVGVLLGQLHHILTADGQPHIPRRLVQIQRKHRTIQAADAGAGDDLRPPAQLGQGAPDAHLIAAARAAACKNQSFCCVLRHLCRLPLCGSGTFPEMNRFFQEYTIFPRKILPVFVTKNMV